LGRTYYSTFIPNTLGIKTTLAMNLYVLSWILSRSVKHLALAAQMQSKRTQNPIQTRVLVE